MAAAGSTAIPMDGRQMLERILYKTQISLLATQLMGPIRMCLDVAQGLSEIERKLLESPKLRAVYDQLSLTNPPESPRPPYEAISLGEMEKLFHRDVEFAARVGKARQMYSEELSAMRRKLHGDRLLRETFINTVRASRNTVAFQDALNALRRLGALSNPTVAPLPALIKEADELAELVR